MSCSELSYGLSFIGEDSFAMLPALAFKNLFRDAIELNDAFLAVLALFARNYDHACAKFSNI